MRIRYKILLVLSLSMIILMGSLLIIAQSSMLDGINASESKYATNNAQRFINNLDLTLSNFNSTVIDWAEWDDTYQFVADNNTDYIQSNLMDETLKTLNLNLLFLYDQSSNLVYGRMYNLTCRTAIAVNQEVLDQLSSYPVLFSGLSSETQGLILLDGMPMLIVSHSILTSNKQGPAHGTLIMGRYLDKQELILLSLTTGLPISTKLYNTSVAGSDFELAKANLSVHQPIFTHPFNETTISAYALLSDVNGKPLVIVRMDDYRTEYIIGTSGVTYFLILLGCLAVCMFTVVAVALDKVVVSRLSDLSDTVTKVRNSGNSSNRVKVQGNDELSVLSENINSMLDTIDRQTFTLEQKVAERTKELANNRKQLESILQASPDAIMAFDLQGNVIECNLRVTELSGFERSELIGQLGLKSVATRSRDQLRKDIQPLYENRGPIRCEIYLVKKAGSEVPVEFSADLVRDENDNPLGVVAIIRDLSEKKQLENQLIESQRLAAIGELAGMVGHDIRNPLAGIRNAVYYIKKKCGGCPNSQVPVMLEIVDKSINHANGIINDLLEYSRKLTLDTVECTPKMLLATALNMVQIPQNIRLIDSTTNSKFLVDEVKVVRVFVNLIKNALDAMPEGGTLEIKSIELDGAVSISFSDTGVGIDEKELPNVFTPLYTTKAQGMGFGLSISKRIVEAHGGSISVKSKPGEGTVFTVNLPIEPKPAVEVNSGLFDALT